MGSFDIIIITNPDSINRQGSNTGVEWLINVYGVLRLESFLYKDQICQIVTDFKKTFVSKIENGSFVNIATVSNYSIWTYDPDQL